MILTKKRKIYCLALYLLALSMKNILQSQFVCHLETGGTHTGFDLT